MKISICIITYKRPDGLKRLLDGLNQLQFHHIPHPTIEVVLVDNDANQSAYPLYKAFQTNVKYSLVYQVEPQRGISYARNHSVACANPDSDMIAFIDDDEVPESTWLEELLIVQQDYEADVVQGRVIPHFQPDVPPWITHGHFFESCRHATGHCLDAAYTHNLLVRASLLRARHPVFDERFALTGGEDSYLFRTLHYQKCKLIWADNAKVYEWIPSSRTTMRWLMMRAYRGCVSYTTWFKEVKASNRGKIVTVLKALFQMGMGLLLLVPSLFLGVVFRVKALIHISQGAGRLAGLLGINYEEYKEIHGT
ncbi:MAG: glycosyltransferase family 2 protein [Merismopedia sp. SIO2A8]|nr:glycosyltransferase family 2 protein [Merismopedia sp. SIO2A8]